MSDAPPPSEPGEALRLPRPVPLDKRHDVSAFDCGKAPLNDFLKRYALQNQSGGSARTYVTVTRTAEASTPVIAYYSLAPGAVMIEDAPDRVTKGQPRHPLPVILMARFAVDRSFQGKGVGKALFKDALLRALQGADTIGGRAFIVHAKDDEARAFYLRFGMEPSPTNPLHLFLLFKDIRQTLGQTG